jgi:hypothetical protein
MHTLPLSIDADDRNERKRIKRKLFLRLRDLHESTASTSFFFVLYPLVSRQLLGPLSIRWRLPRRGNVFGGNLRGSSASKQRRCRRADDWIKRRL